MLSTDDPKLVFPSWAQNHVRHMKKYETHKSKAMMAEYTKMKSEDFAAATIPFCSRKATNK